MLCLGRPIDLLLEAWGVPTGHHPHQLYPAELCACKAVEVILNIGLGVESRNTAKATAQKHAALHLEHDTRGDDADLAKPVRPLEFEGVGGQVVDDDEPRSEDEDDKDRPLGLLITKLSTPSGCSSCSPARRRYGGRTSRVGVRTIAKS